MFRPSWTRIYSGHWMILLWSSPFKCTTGLNILGKHKNYFVSIELHSIIPIDSLFLTIISEMLWINALDPRSVGFKILIVLYSTKNTEWECPKLKISQLASWGSHSPWQIKMLSIKFFCLLFSRELILSLSAAQGIHNCLLVFRKVFTKFLARRSSAFACSFN